jgi:uncharacterized protein
MRPFRIRDPIHGFIELRPEERRAVDSAVFQRLRNIRQLAMTHLVYPGAVHSRFEHSLGVCQVAGRLAVELDELSDDEISIVRAAALLHDLGHGPFSHVSEAVLDERSGVSGVHEAISVAIMRTDSELHAALGEDLCRQAADLVAHEGDFAQRTVLRDIVSGPSDADKLDYLQRDSYFAGVQYGRFDLGRLIDTATIIRPSELESVLGFKAEGLWAVEGLLFARHHMHRQVYGHKTRVATDVMVERALSLGIEDGGVDAAAFQVPIVDAKPAPDEAFLAAYLAQTDTSVLEALLHQERDTRSRDIVRRLTTRKLLRRNARVSLDDERARLGGPRIGRILDPQGMRDRLQEAEASIAERVSCPGDLVALRVEVPGNPVYRNPTPEIGSKDILLSFPDREPDMIHQVSEIFRDEMGPSGRYVSLYSPKDESLTDDQAKELLWEALTSI